MPHTPSITEPDLYIRYKKQIENETGRIMSIKFLSYNHSPQLWFQVESLLWKELLGSSVATLKLAALKVSFGFKNFPST